jgi:hypothetical protein
MRSWFRSALVAMVFLLPVSSSLVASAAAQTSTQPAVGLVDGTNTLIRFDAAAPATLGASMTVTGLASGETLAGIDYRPATGALYGFAVDGSGAVVRVYTINLMTGAATAVGGTVTLPTPGATWDINFNPVVDRIRVVNSADANLRFHPDTGALAGEDTNLSPDTADIDAVAYTPAVGTTTTLYALNAATNSLAVIGGIDGTPSPNGGVVTDIGPLGIAFSGSPAAMDIAANNMAYAALRPASGAQSLYRVNLTTGAATLVGAIGDGTLTLNDIAVIDPSLTLSPPTGTYTTRQSFDLVLLADPQGRAVAAGTASFNGQDVTPFLAACLRQGAGAAGLVSLRCADIGGPVVGAGTHTLQVRLVMSDGSAVQRSVTWTVIPITEP